MAMTAGKGVDVAIEAVGRPETFNLCQELVAPGGHIANVGVHGESVPLHLETLWSRNITITTREGGDIFTIADIGRLLVLDISGHTKIHLCTRQFL